MRVCLFSFWNSFPCVDLLAEAHQQHFTISPTPGRSVLELSADCSAAVLTSQGEGDLHVPYTPPHRMVPRCRLFLPQIISDHTTLSKWQTGSEKHKSRISTCPTCRRRTNTCSLRGTNSKWQTSGAHYNATRYVITTKGGTHGHAPSLQQLHYSFEDHGFLFLGGCSPPQTDPLVLHFKRLSFLTVPSKLSKSYAKWAHQVGADEDCLIGFLNLRQRKWQ